jgi:hypothetical protein
MTLDQQYTENSIRTYTGKCFDIKILDPESICIEDIAHALAYTPRFGGHLEGFYSVAQHSYYVCQELTGTGYELEGLLHDASEAYLGDMPSPFKKLMPCYKDLEHDVSVAIAKKFNIQYPYPKELKQADRWLLSYEWDGFVMGIKPMEYWEPQRAKELFLEMYNSLIQ